MSFDEKNGRMLGVVIGCVLAATAFVPIICAHLITPGWGPFQLQLAPATGYLITIAACVLAGVLIGPPSRNLYLFPMIAGSAAAGIGALLTMSYLLANVHWVYINVLFLVGMIGSAPGWGLMFVLIRLQDALMAGSPEYNRRKEKFRVEYRKGVAEYWREQARGPGPPRVSWGFSVVLIGCIFCFVPVFGLVFSAGGFLLTRQRTGVVRTLAIAGLILSSLSTAIVAILIVCATTEDPAKNRHGHNAAINRPQPANFAPPPPPAPPNALAHTPANDPAIAPAVDAAKPEPADPLESYKRSVSDFLSDNYGRQKDGLEQLLRITPNDVSSPDMRKEIARAFKQVAFNENRYTSDREKAVEGMAVWGGNYSVPLLLELLNAEDSSVREACYRMLAKLRDPRAIEPVARNLCKEPFGDDEALQCLGAFGSDAEEAILKNFPKWPALIDRTLDYLKKHGTEKSLTFLKSMKGSDDWRSHTVQAEETRKAIEKRIPK